MQRAACSGRVTALPRLTFHPTGWHLCVPARWRNRPARGIGKAHHDVRTRRGVPTRRGDTPKKTRERDDQRGGDHSVDSATGMVCGAFAHAAIHRTGNSPRPPGCAPKCPHEYPVIIPTFLPDLPTAPSHLVEALRAHTQYGRSATALRVTRNSILAIAALEGWRERRC
jgi:hypothetical protein